MHTVSCLMYRSLDPSKITRVLSAITRPPLLFFDTCREPLTWNVPDDTNCMVPPTVILLDSSMKRLLIKIVPFVTIVEENKLIPPVMFPDAVILVCVKVILFRSSNLLSIPTNISLMLSVTSRDVFTEVLRTCQ